MMPRELGALVLHRSASPLRALALFLFAGLAAALGVLPSPALANPAADGTPPTLRGFGTFLGHVWTDADGDALPDCGPANPFALAVGETAAIDVWIDSDDFVWTSFEIHLFWDVSGLEFVDAVYVIEGGQVLPPQIDSWSGTIGFSGWSFSESGSTHIARVRFRAASVTGACVWPIFDPGSWTDTWSQVADVEGASRFFREVGATCYEVSEPE
jgi:hypothetical protein